MAAPPTDRVRQSGVPAPGERAGAPPTGAARQAAGAQRASGAPRRSVLFVCVGNSCRSQMAEAFARREGLAAESAGTEPASRVNPTAAAVMQELGIDMPGQRPKALAWSRLGEFDRVVTMGCGVAESCPTLKTDEDWGLDDPVGQPIEVFRAIRDEVGRRVAALARELSASPANGGKAGAPKRP
jgi:arsenate reductase